MQPHENRVAVGPGLADHPATAAPTAAAFQELTLELTMRGEEAVVVKEARVVEEVVIRKEAADRVETVRDTVRRTEVEVEQLSAGSLNTEAGAAQSLRGRTTLQEP